MGQRRFKPRRFTRLKAVAESRFHHNVYVVLLDDEAAKDPAVVRNNPRRDPSKPCVYVGMTGLAPEERFQNHKSGLKAARVVQQHGIKLLPELYEFYNPMPFAAAIQLEQELADDLRREGYTVAGGT